MAVLAVDIGGSGSRALLRDGAAYPAVGSPLRILDGRLSASEALDSLAAQLPAVAGELDVVAVGLASLAAFGEPITLARQVRERWRCRRLVLASDAVMALVAAWGIEGGAVVAAGTGVVGLATDFADEWTRVDGWGHLLGDAGGGAWIGARGLQAAMRAVDGRAGGSPALLMKAEERFGDPTRFPAAIAGVPSPARALAGFVPAVAAAADEGDHVAEDILSEAARERAATAVATVAGARPRRVALVGGLTAIERLVARFEELVGLGSDVLVTSTRTEPVHGALALAEAVRSGRRVPSSHHPYLYLDIPA